MNIDFKLRLDHDVFEDNPELRIIPEFSSGYFTDRMMKYVMLVEWYKSPLRLLKMEDRKYKAALMAGYKLEKSNGKPDMNMRNVMEGKVNSIEAARRAFRGLQHDEEREIDNAFTSQIDEIVQFLKKPSKNAQELEKAMKLMEKLPTLLEKRKQIREILNFREPDVVEVEDNSLGEASVKKSLLDEYNENL